MNRTTETSLDYKSAYWCRLEPHKLGRCTIGKIDYMPTWPRSVSGDGLNWPIAKKMVQEGIEFGQKAYSENEKSPNYIDVFCDGDINSMRVVVDLR